MFRVPEVSGVGSTGEVGILVIKDTDMLAAGDATLRFSLSTFGNSLIINKI